MDLLYQFFTTLRNAKLELNKVYNENFLCFLSNVATNKRARYALKSCVDLDIGDLVAVKTKFNKPFMYPICIVVDIENSLDEVVPVSLRKPNGEIIRRHATQIILLEKFSQVCNAAPVFNVKKDNVKLPKREAANDSNERTKNLCNHNLV